MENHHAKNGKTHLRKPHKETFPRSKGEPGKVVVVEVVLAAVAFAPFLLSFFLRCLAPTQQNPILLFFLGKGGEGSRDIDLPHTEEGGRGP